MPEITRCAQISVFLENRPGALSEVTRTLADAGVNLRALMIAETERFGIMRIIPNDPIAALAALESTGVTTRTIEVVGVTVPDRPGGLADVLSAFDGTEASIEYMYAELTGGPGSARLIMKLNPVDQAIELLRSALS